MITETNSRSWAAGAKAAVLSSAVILFTVWAYLPALDAPFVLDDGRNIIDSPAVHWTEFSIDNVRQVLDSSLLRTRPVANLSFALDHLRVGLEPRGFHVTNVLIHLAVGLVLWWLCCVYARVAAGSNGERQSSLQPPIVALVPVTLFLLHPLNTQAVTYVVQRMTLLAALFTLLAFVSYLTARHRLRPSPGRWYLLAIVSWLLALLSKENAVLLFPVVLLYEVCFFRGEWKARVESRLHRSWAPGWTIIAACTTIALVAILGIVAASLTNSIGLFTEFPGRNFNGVERIMTQCRVQLFHLSQLIWPVPGRLNLDHEFVVSRNLMSPATTLPALIACVGIIGSILFLAVRYPRYGFPLAGYLVFHSLEAGPINLEMVFEHRMYLPVAILAPLLTVFLVVTNRRYQITAIVLLAAFSLLLAGWTNARNQTWAEPLGIHRDMAIKSPNKSRTQYAYALALLEAEQAEDALPILQRAVVLDPDEGRVQRLLGETLLELGRPTEAEEAYRAAVTLTPSDLRSMLGLGQAMAANDKSEVAFRYYVSEGIRLGRAGRSFEAIPLLSAAIELRDDDAGARNALGGAFMGAELVDKALEQFRAAVRLDSTMFEAWFNLAHAAERLGQPQEAIRAYQAFIEHAPDSLQQPIMRARERIRALSSTDE